MTSAPIGDKPIAVLGGTTVVELDPDAAASAKGERGAGTCPKKSRLAIAVARIAGPATRAGVRVAIGITWTAAKVAVPQLTKAAIDRGIERNGPLLAGRC